MKVSKCQKSIIGLKINTVTQIGNKKGEVKQNIFRWKLLQYIIPTKKLLMKWRIAINSQCNFGGQDEDYLHYFMSCPYLKEFWVKIQ